MHERTELSAGHRRPLPYSKLINGNSPSHTSVISTVGPTQISSTMTSSKKSVTTIKQESNVTSTIVKHHFYIDNNEPFNNHISEFQPQPQLNQSKSVFLTNPNNQLISCKSESESEADIKIKVEPISLPIFTPLESTTTTTSALQSLATNTVAAMTPKTQFKIERKTPDLLQNLNNNRVVNIENNNGNNKSNDNELLNNVSNTINIVNYSGKIKPATLSDLEGIDMMHLPIDLDESGNIDILSELPSVPVQPIQIHHQRYHQPNTQQTTLPMQQNLIAPELMQETHNCFLSLVRDIFCSTPDHRINLSNLERKIKSWIKNPITPLNDWYSLSENWLNLLPSAINFLCGDFLDQPDDFVPYLEYKQNLKIYQWIGAGRDTDQHLLPLCKYWFRRKYEMTMASSTTSLIINNQQKPSVSVINDILEESYSSIDMERQMSSPPPPPRYPTNWSVIKANLNEINEFRMQERLRFENPHLAFTYRMHGYESVVGPVKGIYTHQVPGVTKARGHNMLVCDRPNFVTILTLVRDATARLPNGEGTRADICELLKSSQYISSKAADSVLQTIVSGALDRMHTEHDPCVRYDPKRKIWIYLHRNRDKSEFERLHQQFQGVSKHKKIQNRKLKPKSPKLISPSQSLTEVTSQSITPLTNTTSPKILKSPKKPNLIVIPSSQVQTSPAVVQLSPVTVVSPVVSIQTHTSPQPQQMPALTTIPHHPAQTQIPPLTKSITVNQSKRELVPIIPITKQSPITINNTEFIDIEATLDAHQIQNQKSLLISPVQHSQQQQQVIPSLIIDKLAHHNKAKLQHQQQHIVNKSPTTPVKISTSSGIQTVHVTQAQSNTPVSTAGNTNNTNSPTTKSLTSILTSNQSILLNRSQSPIKSVVNQIGKKLITTSINSGGVDGGTAAPKQILISNQAPPLIQSQSGNIVTVTTSSSSVTPSQNYIIPISIGNSSIVSSGAKVIKNSLIQPPGLTSTTKVTSLLQPAQQQQKSGIITRTITPGQLNQQQGKSLINQAMLQQQRANAAISGVVNTNVGTSVSSTGGNSNSSIFTIGTSIASGKSIQIRSNNIITTSASTTTPTTINTSGGISVVTVPSGAGIVKHQTTLTVAQQKQLLQSIIVQQQQQQKQRAALAIATSTGNVVSNTTGNLQQIKSIIISPQTQQSQQQILTGKIQTSTVVSGVTPTISTTNPPQIIQIQHQQIGGKIQNLTPQQQQNIIQTIKQHQLKNQLQQQQQQQQRNSAGVQPQQSLIIKQPIQQTKMTMAGQKSLLGNNLSVPIQTQVVSPANSGSSTIQSNVTRVLKISSGSTITTPTTATLQSSQSQFTGNIIRTKAIGTTSVAGGTPLTAKVLTNSTGQIFSLESLFSKHSIAPGTTLRVANSKPGQTSLIQLASVPGSPIAQYAVVSQGRNLIQVGGTPTQRIITQVSSASGTATTTTTTTATNQTKTTGTYYIHLKITSSFYCVFIF